MRCGRSPSRTTSPLLPGWWRRWCRGRRLRLAAKIKDQLGKVQMSMCAALAKWKQWIRGRRQRLAEKTSRIRDQRSTFNSVKIARQIIESDTLPIFFLTSKHRARLSYVFLSEFQSCTSLRSRKWIPSDDRRSVSSVTPRLFPPPLWLTHNTAIVCPLIVPSPFSPFPLPNPFALLALLSRPLVSGRS